MKLSLFWNFPIGDGKEAATSKKKPPYWEGAGFAMVWLPDEAGLIPLRGPKSTFFCIHGSVEFNLRISNFLLNSLRSTDTLLACGNVVGVDHCVWITNGLAATWLAGTVAVPGPVFAGISEHTAVDELTDPELTGCGYIPAIAFEGTVRFAGLEAEMAEGLAAGVEAIAGMPGFMLDVALVLATGTGADGTEGLELVAADPGFAGALAFVNPVVRTTGFGMGVAGFAVAWFTRVGAILDPGFAKMLGAATAAVATGLLAVTGTPVRTVPVVLGSMPFVGGFGRTAAVLGTTARLSRLGIAAAAPIISSLLFRS